MACKIQYICGMITMSENSITVSRKFPGNIF